MVPVGLPTRRCLAKAAESSAATEAFLGMRIARRQPVCLAGSLRCFGPADEREEEREKRWSRFDKEGEGVRGVSGIPLRC
ncbi:hypothetical protein cyc_09099 [Cyclospora cayetanensis]|uniref:Uncharacterized protein n=1 Tax=Cyclospora cayetanensis TaxID=88456 RepID=A0A1D3CZV6_9EIME|nr:hypothetical protein cyc_09099 [Cyclospora cayetanensis]